MTTTNLQEFNSLLDRLSNANARFVKTAKRFCDRRGNRSPEKQKVLRQQLDASMDVLIGIYARCEVAADAIAADDRMLPATFRPDDNRQLDLWRRAICTVDICATDQIDALADIAAQDDRQY